MINSIGFQILFALCTAGVFAGIAGYCALLVFNTIRSTIKTRSDNLLYMQVIKG